MARVRFIQPNGSERTVEITRDVSVMLIAVRNGVRGIDGECGGCLDCATCHVYVEQSQMGALALPDDNEAEMLSGVSAPRKPNSRLGCQIKVPASLEELVVYVPEARS